MDKNIHGEFDVETIISLAETYFDENIEINKRWEGSVDEVFHRENMRARFIAMHKVPRIKNRVGYGYK